MTGPEGSTLPLQRITVTGVMSGSSMDGVDLALCELQLDPGQGTVKAWRIIDSTTCPLPEPWRRRLTELSRGSAFELASANADFGRFLGEVVRIFHDEADQKPDLVASHGHTIFHEPMASTPFSTQIGDGAQLAGTCGLPVVCDFRNADMAAGGQGAPMAPLADTLLFPDYDAWLNLGGIANLTLRKEHGVSAWDVCGANQILNALAGQLGEPMDRDGMHARKGQILGDLLRQAQADPWLRSPPPRSLSNRQVQEGPVRLFTESKGSIDDRLATAVAFMVGQVKESIPHRKGSILVTGGGACNTFLMERLSEALSLQGWVLRIPAPEVVHFKEALLIALSGALRTIGKPNFVSSATGAFRDVCAGAHFLP